MKKTQQQRIVEALISWGKATIVNGKSKKCITLRSTVEPDRFYFVGKAGSLKTGRNYSESVAVLPQTKTRLIAYSMKADQVAKSLS